MPEPIRHFNNMATPTFFTDVEARYDEYNEYCMLRSDVISYSKDRKSKTYNLDVSGDNRINYIPIGTLELGKNYCQECYDTREKKVLKEIEKFVLSILDSPKITVYIEIQINSLKLLKKQVEEVELDKEFKEHKDTILTKLQLFIDHLKHTYLSKGTSNVATPKIRWKGDLKVLTTLFFELKYGQEKGFGANRFTTPSMLEAEKKDLQALLLSNFLDSEGNPLKPNTINDYLNRAKPEHRSPEGERLEFPEK